MDGRILGRLLLAGAATLVVAGCASVHRWTGLGPSPCVDTTVTLYFDSGSDRLTDAGLQIVRATSNRLKHCPVKALNLLGLSDPSGAPQANLELSKNRGQRVLDAFVEAGLPVESFTLVARGESGAETETGVVEPVRRRVDVTVVMGRR